MSKFESLIKALRCVASQAETGDCYLDYHNTVTPDGPKVTCNTNPPEGYITCPFYQDDFGVCLTDGDLCEWAGTVANILETIPEEVRDELYETASKRSPR